MSYLYEDNIEKPIPYPDHMQRWMPTTQQPYPMNFVQAPSPSNQTLVYLNGRPYLQGLSQSSGPIMFPVRETNCDPKTAWEHKHTSYPKGYCTGRNSAIVYPTTHSIPGPFLQSYIALPRKQYPY